jgi:hypothetical protein
MDHVVAVKHPLSKNVSTPICFDGYLDIWIFDLLTGSSTLSCRCVGTCILHYYQLH